MSGLPGAPRLLDVEAALRRPELPLGGFSPGVVRLEIRRMLRNRRTLIFTMVMPPLYFLIFGLAHGYANLRHGSGNESASILISMALYGAVLATTSGGAMVSIERAAGWSRQLRVTPLRPAAYIAIKMAASLVLGGASVVAVYTVGIFTHTPEMPTWVWVATALCVWIGSLLFTGFGLFVGYLLPSENVMQIMGLVLMLFAFGGGLFIPLRQFSHLLGQIATLTPLWGLNGLVHFPLEAGHFDVGWALNIAVWLAVFTVGAAWRFARDTARV